MSYGYTRTVKTGFGDAVMRLKDALKDRGFGIVSEIDLQAKLKEKLGVEHGRYLILGVCSPKHAHAVLQKEKEIGLLLPCNVIVYDDGDDVKASVILPTKMLEVTENKAIYDIAAEIEKKLKEAVDEACHDK